MKYLGIDWGLKKIGLAISEGELASPLGSYNINSLDEGINKVEEIAFEEDVDVLVIGKPEGEMGKNVSRAVGLLQKDGLNVEVTDETLSTQNAQSKMVEMGFSQKKRKDDDAVSAAIILQGYLDGKKFNN